MKGVGPGTVLGGRYTANRRVAQERGTERWLADDTTLGRRVSVLVVAADDHRAAAFLDAARRAGSVTHPVLLRVLDVGRDDEVAWLVEEELPDARTLAELVADGGVPGDEVRRITGEVAAALESARGRGMHHLDLTPDDVLRTSDGEVRLRGLEVAAVRAGEDGLEPDDAARRDAVGVVALAYAGLTGLWPLGAGAAGLSAAPRVPGGVAAPSEIAAGVPRDLDAICRLTLSDDQGPTSPGDYATQVAPWPSRQVVGRPVQPVRPVLAPEPTGPEPVDTDDEVDDGTPLPADDVRRDDDTARLPVVPAAAGAAAAAVAGGLPDDDTPTREHPAVTPAAEAGDTEPADEPADELDAAPEDDTEVTRVVERPTPPAWATDETPTSDATDVAPVPSDDERPDDPDGPDDPDAPARASASGAAVTAAMASVGTSVSSFARRAVDKVTELSPDTRRDTDDEDDLLAPLVPAEPLTRDQSKLAIGIIITFLVVALVIGIAGIRRIGANTDLGLDGPIATSPTGGASRSPSASASTDEGDTEDSGRPEPLAILKVQAYDPEGDGAENDNLTPKTYDGDTSTGWNSENYRTDAFGGLKKGLGLVVDLGPNKKPQNVELVIPESVDFEVWVGPDASLDGATKIGEKTNAKGTLEFPVPEKVNGQYIVVWYTGLHPDADGKRRAWLDEVVVTG
ncbi:protein kinase family protein [Phycicoccus sp. MAQZ13P-2]|uniref:protein kinase family protein n=1 Tax=Phycicoccus mangrovi TaxID=2840470 RepID=UPI001C0086CD|nr:protein kinase family protein [Phycicoccus mangrovi]MBT9258019.1 protein kinase family protein [Phycicoccus mangrovi]MBT9276003.1 protein kinase family protein [Phycicoccus mangrovi]